MSGRALAMSRVASRRSAVSTPTVAARAPVRRWPGNQALLRATASRAPVQPKLRLSQSGDASERQADAAADAFVALRLNAAHLASSDGRPATQPGNAVPQVNRLCTECGEEYDKPSLVARQEDEPAAADLLVVEEEEEDEEVFDDSEPDVSGMPKRTGVGPATHVDERVIPAGTGAQLAPDVRTELADGFGANLDAVRIHTDADAARSALRLGALAYTVGNHIYFGAGQFAPSTESGARLLAHEMTHVVQQQQGVGQVARQPRRRRRARRGGNVCAAGNCPQGKQDKVIRDDCGSSRPADPSDFITHLEVSLSGQTVVATWSSGSTSTWPCSPNPSVTPTGRDTVGVKCSINHTNLKKDGMAWFTSFRSEGLRIGFHDSQPVGTGIHSHGCVRVCCSVARTINLNTWSGRTTINVT
jgi:hypothetical protein